MAFSWAETITQFSTSLKASHITELRTNINHVRAHMSPTLSAYSWVATITQYSTIELTAHFAELKTALDQAHSVNSCQTYYATHYSGHQSSYNSTHNSTYNSSQG